jgi:hypothetical protein
MSRPLRLEFAGALGHVTMPGHRLSSACVRAAGAASKRRSRDCGGRDAKAPPLDKVRTVGHALWPKSPSPMRRHLLVADLE